MSDTRPSVEERLEKARQDAKAIPGMDSFLDIAIERAVYLADQLEDIKTKRAAGNLEPVKWYIEQRWESALQKYIDLIFTTAKAAMLRKTASAELLETIVSIIDDEVGDIDTKRRVLSRLKSLQEQEAANARKR
jgi:DUF1680 family protein